MEQSNLEACWIPHHQDNTSNKVQDMSVFPYNCIGLVVTEFDGGRLFGTGFLINPLFVLTVAHNVYKLTQKQLGKNVKFMLNHKSGDGSRITYYINKPPNKNQICTYNVIQYMVHPKYFQSKSLDDGKYFDTALLQLNSPVILTQYINFQYKYVVSSSSEIILSGYPANKVQIIDQQFLKAPQYQSTFSIKDPDDINENEIKYKITTKPGQSGSPLLLKDKYNNIIVVGMHQGSSSIERKNNGILLSSHNMNMKTLKLKMDQRIIIYKLTEFQIFQIYKHFMSLHKSRPKPPTFFQLVQLVQLVPFSSQDYIKKKDNQREKRSFSGGQIRISKQLENFKKDPIEQVSAVQLVNENLFHWQGIIIAPDQTPYAGGKFLLNIQFKGEYPISPPYINFLTKVYHPNIDSKGNISLDILHDHWSPALTIRTTLLSILVLLDNPNVDDSLVPEIAQIYKNNRAQYNATAKEWTKKYA